MPEYAIALLEEDVCLYRIVDELSSNWDEVVDLDEGHYGIVTLKLFCHVSNVTQHAIPKFVSHVSSDR